MLKWSSGRFFVGADNLCLQLYNFPVCTVLLRLQIILLNINGASSAQSRYVGQRGAAGAGVIFGGVKVCSVSEAFVWMKEWTCSCAWPTSALQQIRVASLAHTQHKRGVHWCVQDTWTAASCSCIHCQIVPIASVRQFLSCLWWQRGKVVIR